jgi:hypothetical protein
MMQFQQTVIMNYPLHSIHCSFICNVHYDLVICFASDCCDLKPEHPRPGDRSDAASSQPSSCWKQRQTGRSRCHILCSEHARPEYGLLPGAPRSHCAAPTKLPRCPCAALVPPPTMLPRCPCAALALPSRRSCSRPAPPSHSPRIALAPPLRRPRASPAPLSRAAV